MTASIWERTKRLDSPSALERSLTNRKWTNDELALGFETGQAHTRRASSQPRGSLGRIASQFISCDDRDYPKSPNRSASTQRRRTWAGSSGMPKGLRAVYTEGERASLCVVADQVKRHGYCDLSLDALAGLAGVSRTTVQNALRKAQLDRNKHVAVEARPRPGRKNLTNVITIISKAWLGWLKRSIGFKSLYPSKIKEQESSLSQKEEMPKGAFEGDEEVLRTSMPPTALAQLSQIALLGVRHARESAARSLWEGVFGPDRVPVD